MYQSYSYNCSKQYITGLEVAASTSSAPILSPPLRRLARRSALLSL